MGLANGRKAARRERPLTNADPEFARDHIFKLIDDRMRRSGIREPLRRRARNRPEPLLGFVLVELVSHGAAPRRSLQRQSKQNPIRCRVSQKRGRAARGGPKLSPLRGRPQSRNKSFGKTEACAKIRCALGDAEAPNASARTERSRERFFAPRCHDNRLKRLVSDKRIQGNPGFSFGKIWLGLGLAWLGFEKFGGALGAAAWGLF
jgi:hypothetical protein